MMHQRCLWHLDDYHPTNNPSTGQAHGPRSPSPLRLIVLRRKLAQPVTCARPGPCTGSAVWRVVAIDIEATGLCERNLRRAMTLSDFGLCPGYDGVELLVPWL